VHLARNGPSACCSVALKRPGCLPTPLSLARRTLAAMCWTTSSWRRTASGSSAPAARGVVEPANPLCRAGIWPIRSRILRRQTKRGSPAAIADRRGRSTRDRVRLRFTALVIRRPASRRSRPTMTPASGSSSPRHMPDLLVRAVGPADLDLDVELFFRCVGFLRRWRADRGAVSAARCGPLRRQQPDPGGAFHEVTRDRRDAQVLHAAGADRTPRVTALRVAQEFQRRLVRDDP
jgi:hypothetical protein